MTSSFFLDECSSMLNCAKMSNDNNQFFRDIISAGAIIAGLVVLVVATAAFGVTYWLLTAASEESTISCANQDSAQS